MKKGKADQFLMGADSSDEDSDEGDKTVVLSAKDKRFVEMDAAIQNIKNATKGEGAANDWVVAASGKSIHVEQGKC
jgi:translation initiation factor 3 subunit C